MSFSVFDSTKNYYRLYHLENNGDTMLVERIAKDGFSQIDTTYGYHPNGETAFWRVYENGQKHGRFQVFDSLGNMLYTGEYYKGVRIGKWYTLSQRGKIIDEVSYNYNLSDSSAIESDLQDSIPYIMSHIRYDTLTLFIAEDSYGMMIMEGSVGIVETIKTKRKRAYSDHHWIYSDGILREED